MRTTSLVRVLILFLVVFTPLLSYGADTARFRYVSSLYEDDKGTGFIQPEGIACGKDRLVVADTGNGRLILYTVQDGTPKEGKAVKLPQVLYPLRLKITSQGDILVLDERQRKIVRLTGEGAFKQYIEPTGMPSPGMIVPAAIDLDQSDNLYVLDIAGNRVLVLDSGGAYQRQIALPADAGFFGAMAVDPKGTVYVVDSVNAVVYSNAKAPASFGAITGSMKGDLKFGATATLDKGALYIADEHGGGIVVLASDGTFRSRQLNFGYQEGFLRYPAQLCIDGVGNLFIADRENSRVEEFTPLK